MFSLVGVREAFPHLNGVDQLSRLFKRPIDPISGRRASSGSIPQHIWAIPGHILVSLKEGTKLLAYNFHARSSSLPDSAELLSIGRAYSSVADAPSAVLSIFQTERDPSLLFIVMKDGEIFVMKFTSQKNEWAVVTSLNLCKSKKTQIISVCFSVATDDIFWCEKRSPTQCCVCKSAVRWHTNIPSLDKTEAILHNCPPMQLLSLGYWGLCMKPIANNPPNVLIFWLHEYQRLQVFSFSCSDEEMSVQPSSSDYRNTILETISLWITNTSGIQLVSICTHSETDELLVLDSKMNIYLVSFNRACVIRRRMLCTLDSGNNEDTFRPVDFFAFKFFIGTILHNGEVNIFEIHSGKLVWKSDSLKSSGPKRLYAKGMVPLLGFWNLSGLWILKSEPILKQAETLFKVICGEFDSEGSCEIKPKRRISKDYTVQDTGGSTEGAVSNSARRASFKDVFVQVDDSDTNSTLSNDCCTKGVHTLVSEKVERGLLGVLRFLFHWNSADIKNEFLLKLLHDRERKDILHHLPIEAIDCVSDPLLTLVLFGDDDKFSNKIEEKLQKVIDASNSGKEESIDEGHKQVCQYISEYLSVCKQQKDVQKGLQVDCSQMRGHKTLDDPDRKDLWQLLTDMPAESYLKFCRLHMMYPRAFLVSVLYVTGVISRETAKDELTDDTNTFTGFLPCSEERDELHHKLWKLLLSPETELFEFICWGLWNNLPGYLVGFVKEAAKFADAATSKECSLYTSKIDVYGRCLSALPPATQLLKEGETLVLAEILLLSEADDAESTAMDLYLRRRCYTQALDQLSMYSNDTDKYGSLFSRILSAIIKTKDIDGHMERICSEAPDNFTALDFCHLLQSIDLDGTATSVFSSTSRELSVGSVSALFEKLVQQS